VLDEEGLKDVGTLSVKVVCKDSDDSEELATLLDDAPMELSEEPEAEVL
jgi:hypothetical protein